VFIPAASLGKLRHGAIIPRCGRHIFVASAGAKLPVQSFGEVFP
jgi:hypothetical protein